MDFDIYQIPKTNPDTTLNEFLDQTAKDSDGTDVSIRNVNGIDVGVFRATEVYDEINYNVLVTLIEDENEFIKVLFWLDGETAEQKAEDILKTLAPVKTFELKLGESPFCITVSEGYVLGEVTEEEAADDMIAYYYNETTPLDFDIYEFGKDGKTIEITPLKRQNSTKRSVLITKL